MAQVRDVVCGMTVDTETAEYTSQYRGQTYYFCSRDCKRAFDLEPQAYITEEMASSGNKRNAR
jgi:YHS domain-containing protein